MTALPNRRAPPATALISAAVVGVILVDEIDNVDSTLLLRGLAGILLISLLVAVRRWLATPNGRLAFGLAAATAIAGATFHVPVWTIFDGAAAMIPAAVLLITTSLVRPAFTSCGLDRYLAATITRVPAKLRSCGVDTFATVTGLAAGFGSIAMLGSALGNRAAPSSAAANASMRGLSMSMLLGPSIASVAVIRTTLPPIPWVTSIVTALPLVAASLAFNAMLTPTIQVRADTKAGRRLPSHLLAVVMLAGVPVLAIAGSSIGMLGATESITVACLVTGLALSYLHSRRGTTAVLDRHICEGWRRSQPEIALFIASGAITSLLRDPTIATLLQPVAALVPNGPLGVVWLVVIVPALCVVGLHPMPLFAMLAPLVPAQHLGLNGVGLYQIWIVTVGIGLLLSPASILNSVTSSAFGLEPSQVGMRRNLVYAVLIAVFAVIVVPAINPA